MFTIDDLADRLGGYLPPDEIQQVKRAFYYAEQAHDGQRRRSGEPYVTHPLAVANILANMHMDHQSLMAAMLHDVIEDTGVSKKALEAQFGKPVAELVDGVSKLTQITFEDKAVAQAENFQKMVLAMSRDIRVIIVKLADRLHNMRTLGALRPDKKRASPVKHWKFTRALPVGWVLTPSALSSKISPFKRFTRCVQSALSVRLLKREGTGAVPCVKSSRRCKKAWMMMPLTAR